MYIYIYYIHTYLGIHVRVRVYIYIHVIYDVRICMHMDSRTLPGMDTGSISGLHERESFGPLGLPETYGSRSELRSSPVTALGHGIES